MTHVEELFAEDPRFFCETCRACHPISEHKRCRAGLPPVPAEAAS